ncbi:ABC transporter ATP-binding protein [Bacteroidota bacterium]
MLEVIKLTKDFKGHRAIDDISFSIEKGNIFGIIGPNGAGKTTTIRTILNIIKPTSGKVLFSGNPISNDVYNRIGYLPEERGLYKKSKVADIIKYFARLKNMSRHEISLRSQNLMSRLDLANFGNKYVYELSKGNQQKVQFLTSIIHEPEILILDEPFTGLDPINQSVIKSVIAEFIDSGKIVLLSTHMMEVAESLCSDIFLLNKGKEILSGPLPRVKENFGKNTYKIKFKGDPSVLEDLDDIEILKIYDDTADIIINSDVDPAEIIPTISKRIRIHHFTYIEPTLNNIFIETVLASNKSE